jgi:hypothetical protein
LGGNLVRGCIHVKQEFSAVFFRGSFVSLLGARVRAVVEDRNARRRSHERQNCAMRGRYGKEIID